MDAQFDHNDDPQVVAHEITYHAFNMLVRWSMVLLAALITVLTVWFATPGGALGGLFSGLVVFVGGYLGVIRHEARQPLDLWVEGR